MKFARRAQKKANKQSVRDEKQDRIHEIAEKLLLQSANKYEFLRKRATAWKNLARKHTGERRMVAELRGVLVEAYGELNQLLPADHPLLSDINVIMQRTADA